MKEKSLIYLKTISKGKQSSHSALNPPASHPSQIICHCIGGVGRNVMEQKQPVIFLILAT